ncbi:MAG: DNA-3-methyladenine glycosylase 2 family protein [Moraxellaceae bacterium]|nr:MAG: DNA-3-methyladenine glycosylase 2 family protein [Moraxellaceae bacterium]
MPDSNTLILQAQVLQGQLSQLDHQSGQQNQQYQRATAYLAGLDQHWQQHIDRIGDCLLEVNSSQQPFEALIRAIAHQQLHAKAAGAILNRFLNLYEQSFPTAAQLLQTDPAQLRACGFSARKLEAILGIAVAYQAGQVPDLTMAQQMPSEQLIEQLILLKGVGRWTVEMLLIFNLGRLDVWPVDDYAVRQGYQRLQQLPQPLTKKQLRLVGEQLAPYQSIAAWYLWRLMD